MLFNVFATLVTRPARPVALLLLLLIGAHGAVAQEQEPTKGTEPGGEKGVFSETVQVNVVNVDVVVTDRDGNPVTDLKRDDFVVHEDGKPVEIKYFDVLRSKAPPAAAESIETAPPTPAETADQAPAGTDESPVSVVLLVDNANIRAANRNRVFRRLEEFLGRATRLKTRIMVASYDNGIHVQQRFTTDAGQVREVLQQLEKKYAGAVDIEIERRNVLREIERVDLASSDPSDLESAARSVYNSIHFFANRQWDTTRRLLSSVGSFVESLAGLPGRKALVLVSEGVQTRPGESLYNTWAGKFGGFAFARSILSSLPSEIDTRNVSEDLRGLVRRANASRVAIYTVNAAVGRNASLVDPAEGSLDLSALNTPGGGLSSTPALTAARFADLDDSLNYISQGTGGLFFANQDDMSGVVKQVESDARNYYSLGYSPPRPPDDAFHRIDVEVKRPGLKVRHLRRLKEKTSDERLTDLTLSSLLLAQGENPLGVRLEMGNEEKAKHGNWVVTVMVRIPITSLALAQEDAFHQGHLSMYLIVQDENGALSPPRKVPIPVKIPQARFREALEQDAGYRVNLLMRPGDQRIAVGVRDDMSSVSSSVSLDVHVGDT